MFGDSQALFTDSNAIFSPNLSPREQQQENNLVFAKSKMNFDMNNIIQDNYNNKSEDCNGDFMGESLNDDVNHKSLSNGFVLNNSELMSSYTTRPSSSSGLATTQIGGLDNPGLYRMASSSTSNGMDNHVNMASGLVRQSSSPAGFVSHLTSQSGYGGIRGSVGNYRLGNGCNGELSPTGSRLKSHTSLSSRIPSSLGMLSRISEIDGGNIGPTNHDDAKNQSVHGDTQYYNSEYPLSSWNDSLHFAENYSVLKREIDDDEMLFSSPQKGEITNRPSLLSHHLSLPKTSSDVSYMDKLLKFQDSVPCKIRAKRGCATHPRSIAERVRRTRISERMRKLQELVPHMDKQTNTADMLDLAVDYIKDLQKQYKTLGDSRRNCKCSAMQKQSIE